MIAVHNIAIFYFGFYTFISVFKVTQTHMNLEQVLFLLLEKKTKVNKLGVCIEYK